MQGFSIRSTQLTMVQTMNLFPAAQVMRNASDVQSKLFHSILTRDGKLISTPIWSATASKISLC